MHLNFIIQALADRHLGPSRFLAIVIRAAANTDVQTSVEQDVESWGVRPRVVWMEAVIHF